MKIDDNTIIEAITHHLIKKGFHAALVNNCPRGYFELDYICRIYTDDYQVDNRNHMIATITTSPTPGFFTIIYESPIHNNEFQEKDYDYQDPNFLDQILALIKSLV